MKNSKSLGLAVTTFLIWLAPISKIKMTQKVKPPDWIPAGPFKPGSLIVFEKKRVADWSIDFNGAALGELDGSSYLFIGIGLDPNEFNRLAGIRVTNAQNSDFFEVSLRTVPFTDQEPSVLRLQDPKWKSSDVSSPHSLKLIERALESRSLAQNSVSPCLQKPIDSVVTSRFGSLRRLPNGKTYFHTGVDLRARIGTPVLAPTAGVVLGNDFDAVYGNYMLIDHGAELVSVLAHLQKFKVEKGQKFNRGEILAFSGSTGRVEAPHLHWELVWRGRFLNPLEVVQTLEPLCDSL